MSDIHYIRKNTPFENILHCKTQLLCDGDSFLELSKVKPFHKNRRRPKNLSDYNSQHKKSRDRKVSHGKDNSLFCCTKRKATKKKHSKQRSPRKSKSRSVNECPLHKGKIKNLRQQALENTKPTSYQDYNQLERYQAIAKLPRYKDSNGNSKTFGYQHIGPESTENRENHFVNFSNRVDLNNLQSHLKPYPSSYKNVNVKNKGKTQASLWKLNSEGESSTQAGNSPTSNKSETKRSRNNYSETLGLLLQLLTKTKLKIASDSSNVRETKKLKERNDIFNENNEVDESIELPDYRENVEDDVNLIKGENVSHLSLEYHGNKEHSPLNDYDYLEKKGMSRNPDIQGDSPSIINEYSRDFNNTPQFYTDSIGKITNIIFQLMISEGLVASSNKVEKKKSVDLSKVDNLTCRAMKKILKLVRKDILAKTKLNVEIRRKKTMNTISNVALRTSCGTNIVEDDPDPYFLDMLTKKSTDKISAITVKDILSNFNEETGGIKKYEDIVNNTTTVINVIIINFLINKLWKKISKKFINDVIVNNKKPLQNNFFSSVKKDQMLEDAQQINEELINEQCSLGNKSLESGRISVQSEQNEREKDSKFGLGDTSFEIKRNYEILRKANGSCDNVDSKVSSNKKNISKSMMIAKAFIKYIKSRNYKQKDNKQHTSYQKSDSICKDKAIKSTDCMGSKQNVSDTNEDVSTFLESSCVSQQAQHKMVETPVSQSSSLKAVKTPRKNKNPKISKKPGLIFYHSANRKKYRDKSIKQNHKSKIRRKIEKPRPIYIYKHGCKTLEDQNQEVSEADSGSAYSNEFSGKQHEVSECNDDSSHTDVVDQKSPEVQTCTRVPLLKRFKNFLGNRSCSGSHDVREVYRCPQHGFKKRILSAGFIYRQSLHQNNMGNAEMNEEDCDEMVEYFEDEKEGLSVILE